MKSYWKILFLCLFVLSVVILWSRKPCREPEVSPVAQAKSLQDSFVEVAEKCSDAVVVITTGRRVASRNHNHAYNQLYNYFNYGKVPEEQTVSTGLGSGFFVSNDGYILTNYHIVRNQDVFTVKLKDERSYNAELVGSDPLSDLAVLKINSPDKFSYLEFADSDRIQVGHWAIAIGAPFSLAHTVTVGIVSHKQRAMGMNVYENFIQTDASINQGNSGGPLLDLNGKVIGVNDFILSSGRGGNIGLSFAIASNLARKVCESLIKDGRVIRPWLGVSLGEITPEQRAQLKIRSGVVVAGVVSGGPAHSSGIDAGDIILSLGDREVFSSRDIQSVVFESNIGENLKLKVFRNNKVSELEIKLEKMPESSWR